MSVKVPPISTPTRIPVIRIAHSAASRGDAGFVPIPEDCRGLPPLAPGAQPRAAIAGSPPRRRRAAHSATPRRSRGRRRRRDQLVLDVAQDHRRIAFQRIAPAAGTGDLMAEHVAAPDRHRQFRRAAARFSRVGVQVVHRRLARAAAIEPVRPEVAPVGAHLQYAFLGQKTVVAAERRTAAIFPGPIASGMNS